VSFRGMTSNGIYLYLFSETNFVEYDINTEAQTGNIYGVPELNLNGYLGSGAIYYNGYIGGIADGAIGDRFFSFEMNPTWLNIDSGNSGTLSSGNSSTINLSLNAENLSNIERNAKIMITATSFKQTLEIEIPVSMIVTQNSSISNNHINRTNFQLTQNYPNPFNPMTKINYELGISNFETAEIVVFNAAGQKVWNSKALSQNTKHYTFDGSKFNSGIYYYSLVIDGKKIDTKSMILIK